MSNEYFNFTAPLSRDTLARAEQVNAYFTTIAAGFDKLPTPAYLTEGLSTFSTDTGVADQYEITMPTPPTAYTAGLTMSFLALATNTGASTIDVYNAVPTLIGAIAIKRVDGGDLAEGDIVAGALVTCSYDGTYFQLVSPHAADVALAAASAAAALVSETNAATSETNAAASFLSFDIRYLGAKAVAPTLDNDGNALIVGATYFNTAVDAMYVWDGAAWILNNGSVGITDNATSSQITITDTVTTFGGDVYVNSAGQIGVENFGVTGQVHFQQGSSGATAATDSDQLVLEGSTNSRMTMLAAPTGDCRIVFGDSGSSFIGWIEYDHNVNAMNVRVNGSNALTIDSLLDATFAGRIISDDTTASTSTTTGSGVLAGGFGVAGAIYAGGRISTTVSTDLAMHAIQTGATNSQALLVDYQNAGGSSGATQAIFRVLNSGSSGRKIASFGDLVTIDNAGNLVASGELVSVSASTSILKGTHDNRFVKVTAAGATTMTINNAGGAYKTGDSIIFVQEGAGQITIAAGATYTLRKATDRAATSREQYTSCTVTFISATEFVVDGNLTVI